MSSTFAWRNVTRHRTRTILILIAVTISVALETGIVITLDSLYDDFIDTHRGNYFTDITIHPRFNSTLTDIRSLADQVKSIEGIEKVSPVAVYTISKINTRLENITNNIILYGLETETHPDYLYLKGAQGNPLNPPDTVVTLSIVKELDLLSGDSFYLPADNRTGFLGLNAKIAGLMSDRTDFGGYGGFYFILLDIEYMQTLFNTTEHLDFQVATRIKDFTAINSIAERIQDSIGHNYNVFREKPVSETELLAIRSYQTAMILVIIVSFFVEFLFITNILSMNIRDRAKEFGILRSLGSSNRQLIIFLGLEVLFYAIIGNILGNILGIGFSFVSVFFLNINFETVKIDAIAFKLPSIITIFGIGMGITMVTGLYPMYKALSLPIIQNIHTKYTHKKGKTRYRRYLGIGAVLTIIGIIFASTLESNEFLEFNVFSSYFFAICFIFIGIFIFEIGLLHFLPKVGIKLLIWYRNIPKTIATRNISREEQKASITIMVTALALSFIIVISILSGAIVEAVPKFYEERYGRIDIIAETNDDTQILLSFADELATNNSDIEKIAFIQQERTKIANGQGYIFGVDPSSFEYFIEENMINPIDTNVTQLLNATEKGAIISNILLNKIGTRIGEDLEIQISPDESVIVKITGIVTGNPFLQNGDYLFISNILFQEYWAINTAKWFVMKLSPDSESGGVVANQLLGQYPSLKEVIPVETYARIVKGALSGTELFFQILIFYAFLLAALAQFLNTLMSLMRMEREVAMMRAIGLSNNHVLSIFSSEAILLGTTGIVIGIINGLIGVELLRWYISFSIPLQATINFNFILIWVIISLIITIASSEITSRRTLSTVIASALQGDLRVQMSRRKSQWHDYGLFIDSQSERRFDY